MSRLIGMGLLGAALALAAGLFDAEALWVPGVGLVVLAALLIAALRLAAAGARVERRLDRSRVEEDEPLGVDVSVRAGRLGFAGGEGRVGRPGGATPPGPPGPLPVSGAPGPARPPARGP